MFLKRHLSFCSGWNIFCHILLTDQFCRILCQSYNLSIVEQLYYIKWKCLQYLRKTFFTLNPIQNFLSCVCKHRFSKKLSNIWTIFLLHSASKWAIYAEVGSSVWILSSPHMQNLQSAGSISSPRARKSFLYITYKTNTYTYQINGIGLDCPPISILWNLLIFEWTEKTDLAQSVFKKVILPGRIQGTQVLRICAAILNSS